MTRRALTAIAALALAGCGGVEPAEQAASEPSKTTAEAGTSRIMVSFGTAPVLSGTFDYERKTGVFAKGKDMPDMIWTPDAVYTSLDQYGHDVDVPGKHWIKNDRLLHQGATPLFLPFAGSPSELLDFMRAAGDFEKLEAGSERGIDVTRYRARLGMDRAIRELEHDHRELQAWYITMKGYWPEAEDAEISVDLAIDGNDRLRKLSMPIPEDSRLTLEFYDYGLEVDAKAPPADQVMTWEEFNDALREACKGVDEEGYGDSDEVAACIVAGGLND